MSNNVQLPIRYEAIGNAFSGQVVDLILPIQQKEFNVSVDLAAQPDLMDIDRYYLSTGGGFWGALDEDQIIGTIALIAFPVPPQVSVNPHQDDLSPAPARAGAIRKMFVKKEFRGKEHGIARHLLTLLIDHCRQTGIHDLYLGTVDVLKASHRFYEKNGFSRIDPQNLPPSFPRMAVDTIFYHRSL